MGLITKKMKKKNLVKLPLKTSTNYTVPVAHNHDSGSSDREGHQSGNLQLRSQYTYMCLLKGPIITSCFCL